MMLFVSEYTYSSWRPFSYELLAIARYWELHRYCVAPRVSEVGRYQRVAEGMLRATEHLRTQLLGTRMPSATFFLELEIQRSRRL